MRVLGEDLARRLAEPATTLANAWRLRRPDGRIDGFTDHDENLVFAGTTFRAATGWTAGEAESALGLAAGTQGVEGALSSDALDEAEIAAGLFDGARVEIFRVDWRMPAAAALVEVCDLGEVTRGRGGFTAELRSLAARLDRIHGRTYRRRCDAALGDRRCGVDLHAWTRRGTLVRREGEATIVAGLPDLDRALFERGRIALGENGEPADIRDLAPAAEDGCWRVTPVRQPAGATSDATVRLVAGCDRSFRTCRDRFANGVNFRGFPHLPGTDIALGVAKRDAAHDGTPVVA
ncbi:DUF2163 domain-containing protein [Aureimonas pseudogalii]|uniref:Putative phage protein (TIGR02218 family) n=1 Tax=Aureimonas pseudogalii TaxID=1744844 RepID=A0A7W6E898_9HYPH|nr:DUF2163 domain-containing protein [Aureimonas pseudogalii]MBB3996565.1 putative phage protein (TIGR02218 family) [Aureimonas pseudogalii]